MNALKLCNSSSTLASVEKGFEGKLVDLWWVVAMVLDAMEDKKRRAILSRHHCWASYLLARGRSNKKRFARLLVKERVDSASGT
jgi:hypothetical protein